jgi:hypothetical protein
MNVYGEEARKIIKLIKILQDTRHTNSDEFRILLLLSILTANGFLPGGSGTTIRHNTQTITAHKTTQTIKDTLHTMNTMQIQLQLQLNKLIYQQYL